MTKTKRICSYALMLAALGLGSSPLQVEAKECVVDRNDAEMDVLSEGDSLKIGYAVTNNKMQEILEQIPQETKLEELTFYVEPLEDIHITHGTFDEIVLQYVSTEADAEHAPAVCVEQDARTDQVRVIGGNAKIATNEPLKTLTLGEIDGQKKGRICENEILQHVQIGADVQSLSVLHKTMDSDYIYGTESVRGAQDYNNYAGDCILEPGYSVGNIDLYEYYYDGVLEKDVLLCKEFAPADQMPYGMQDAEPALFRKGEWNSELFPLEKRTDWQQNYEKEQGYVFAYQGSFTDGKMHWKRTAEKDGRYLSSYELEEAFSQDRIPADSRLIIEGDLTKPVKLNGNYDNLTLRTGLIEVMGNVKELVIQDRTRFFPETGGLEVRVNGDVSRLVLLGDCVDTQLIINGSIGVGRKSSCVRGPDELGYAYFSIAKEESGLIWADGMPAEGIYFYEDEACSGAGYRISGSPQQNAARFGVDYRGQQNYYNRIAFDNLGMEFSMALLTEEEQKNILAQICGKTDEHLDYAGLAFALSPMSYYETEDGLYMTEDAGAWHRMASEPVEFQMRLPDEWIQKESYFSREPALIQYYIVRMHRNPQTGELEYALLDCEKEGALLRFMTDRFSTFAVIRGTMTIPEDVPEQEREEMPEKLPEQEVETIPEIMPVTESEEAPVSGKNMTVLSTEMTEKETEPSITHTYAPDTGDDTPDICGLFASFLVGMFIICWLCAICRSKNKKLPFDTLIFMVK